MTFNARTIGRIIAAVCIFSAVLPGVRHKTSREGQQSLRTITYSVGIPSSPLWSYSSSTQGADTFSFEAGLHIASISMVLL